MTAINDRAAWQRRGECNRCGYCCRFSFDPVQLFFPNGDAKREAFLKLRGFSPAHDGEQAGLSRWARIYDQCEHHVADGCAIFGQDARPQMCADFPSKPSQVVGTPCSYWFEDSSGREPPVGGDGSPHGDSNAKHEDVAGLTDMGM